MKKQKRFNKLMNEVRDLAWKFYQLGKLSECREITLEVYGPGKLMSDSKPYQYKKLKLAYQLMQSKYRKILLAEITKFENLLEEFEQR